MTSPRKRTRHLRAVADASHALPTGLAVVASYQMTPVTRRPFKVRGVAESAKLRQSIEISLSCDEARKLVEDFRSFRPDVIV